MADRPRNRARSAGEADGTAPPPSIGARDVVAYLRRHPDFLDRYPEAVRLLQPPARDAGAGVLDFQHFLLDRLRREAVRAAGEQRSLIAASRVQLTSQGRVHKGVLAILAATSFEQLLQTVTTDLALLLDVDVVTIAVESAATPAARLPMAGIHLLRAGAVDALLGADGTVRLAVGVRGEPALFGAGAGLVRAQALLRLSFGRGAPAGVLCIGTRRDTLPAGLGNELLGFLARALGITIAQWIDPGH